MGSKEMYEELWKNVDDWKNPGGAYRHKEPEKELVEFVQLLKEKNITGSVLDIGCGGGRNSVYFAQQGFDVTGIDYTKSAIRLSKLLANEKNVDVDFKVFDIIKDDPGEFDIVIDFGCFHHLVPEQRKKYLEHLHFRKAYFLFCFSVNSTKVKGINPTEEKNFIEEDSHYTHFFTAKELKEIFGDDIELTEVSHGYSKKFWLVTALKD